MLDPDVVILRWPLIILKQKDIYCVTLDWPKSGLTSGVVSCPHPPTPGLKMEMHCTFICKSFQAGFSAVLIKCPSKPLSMPIYSEWYDTMHGNTYLDTLVQISPCLKKITEHKMATLNCIQPGHGIMIQQQSWFLLKRYKTIEGTKILFALLRVILHGNPKQSIFTDIWAYIYTNNITSLYV